jgi:ABC-2 type transport system ATP-binding protein
MDPQSRIALWQYLGRLKRDGLTILLTTQYLEEADRVCDRIAIIDHGKIVVLDTPEALKAAVGKDRVQIQTPDDQAAIAALRERFGLEGGVHEGAVTFFVADGEQFVPRLFAELGVPIRSVSVTRPTLDDVFMSHTGKTIRDAEAANPLRAMAAAFRRR